MIPCPECGWQQRLPDGPCARCGAAPAGAKLAGPRFRAGDYFGYSAYTVAIVLIALGVPCAVGLICFYLGR